MTMINTEDKRRAPSGDSATSSFPGRQIKAASHSRHACQPVETEGPLSVCVLHLQLSTIYLLD
jgi:hypothetical protein